MNKNYRNLRILGIVQLVAYIAVLVWSYSPKTSQSSSSFFPNDCVVNPFACGGAPVLSPMPLWFGSITLIPSVWIFIDSPRVRNVEALQTAKTMQFVLFIACCLAIIPSFAAALNFDDGQLLVASLLGVIFYPIARAYVEQIVETSSTPRPATPDSMRYCIKCGTQLNDSGSCSECQVEIEEPVTKEFRPNLVNCRNLRVLGIIQLITYIAVLAWPFSTSVPLAEWAHTALRFGSITLIPSVWIFIASPKVRSAESLRTAKTMQFLLFIACCVAVIPSIEIAAYPEGSIILIATMIGILFFPITKGLVDKALREDSGKLELD